MPSTDRPSSEADASAPLQTRVEAFITQIRPTIQSDGGDVEFVELDAENVVKIRFHGACVGCPSSQITLKHGIERSLMQRIPEIAAVEQVA